MRFWFVKHLVDFCLLGFVCQIHGEVGLTNKNLTNKNQRPGEVGRRSGSFALPPAGPSRQTHDDDHHEDDNDDDDEDDDHDHDHYNEPEHENEFEEHLQGNAYCYCNNFAYHTRLFQQIIIYVASNRVA